MQRRISFQNIIQRGKLKLVVRIVCSAFVLLKWFTVEGNVTVSWGEPNFTPVMCILLSFWRRCRNPRHIHWAAAQTGDRPWYTNTPHVNNPRPASTMPYWQHLSLTCKPLKMNLTYRWEWEKQRRRDCCSRVLIVCSLSLFYVTTTHCFSSTYGRVPGMCFLSLVLMTWVTSLTLHMLWRDEPTTQGLKHLKSWWCFGCWMVTLNLYRGILSDLWHRIFMYQKT